jgi:predicted N-acyltransferase
MILNLDPNWKTFDDYLEDMKSKYRVRARKAMQKATNIKKVVFQEEDIATHRKVIHTLYIKTYQTKQILTPLCSTNNISKI